MTHPARTMAFDELLAGLTAEVEAGNVNVLANGPLRLYKYTEQCAFERRWSPFSLMARGLILDVEAREVVATPYVKFFNYGEGMAPLTPMEPLPDESFTTTEKIDGSLGIIFYHDSRWRVATRGSFISEQAQWAQAQLDTFDLTRLTPGTTYLAEIVYPQNRIVVSYDYAALVLLSAYEADGRELDYVELAGPALAGFKLVPIYLGAKLDMLLDLAKTLPASEEGFVVRFASGRRVKIKGDEYCRIHKLVSRITPLGIYDLLVAGDDLDKVRLQLPEEFQRDFIRIIEMLLKKIERWKRRVHAATQVTAEKSDKELGLWLQTQTMVGPEIARWIFPNRKQNFLEEISKPERADLRNRAYQFCRPTGNRLEGYIPSSAMNRFEETA